METTKERVFQFTKEERHAIYKKALDLYKKECIDNFGLCFALSYCNCIDPTENRPNESENPYGAYGESMEYRYPEIWKQKPNENNGFWWPVEESEPRIQVLKNAIKMTE